MLSLRHAEAAIVVPSGKLLGGQCSGAVHTAGHTRHRQEGVRTLRPTLAARQQGCRPTRLREQSMPVHSGGQMHSPQLVGSAVTFSALR